MNKLRLIPPLSLALAAWSSVAWAQQTVVLPGVVGQVGMSSGVITQGPGLLTVGAQDINTANINAAGITTNAANTANILFTGSSTVNGFVGTSGSTFSNISAGVGGSTVTFNGAVFSTTASVSGTGTVNFNQGFVSNSGSTLDFAGDGFITVGAGQTVKAAITNTAGAHTGTLTLNANSIVNGAVGASSGLKAINVVGGNALITGQAQAASYNLGVNTLNVGGALAIPVAGTITTTIASQSVYGKITPVGAASIGNALQVKVAVTGAIVNGSSFNIVNATSGTSGSTVIATSSSPLYAFTATPTTAGLVTITAAKIPLAAVVAPIATPGVTPVAPGTVSPAVDALPLTPTTAPLLNALAQLPTAAAIAQALAQLGPGEANLASPRVSFQAAQRFQDQLASYLEAQEACGQDSQSHDRTQWRLADSSICQDGDRHGHLWVTGFGYSSPFSADRQGDVSGYEGYQSRIYGGMLAYDAPVSRTVHVGVGVRYAQSSIDGNAASVAGGPSNSHTNINSYQITAYVGYAPGPFYINGALTYGLDRYSSSRLVEYPGVDSVLASTYSGDQTTVFGTTGYHFYPGDGRTVLTPFASLQYTDLHAGAYAEGGNPALDLTVNAQHYDFVESGLGAKIARYVVLSGSMVVQPELHAQWLHSLSADSMTNIAAFTAGGPAFTTVGLKPDPNTYNLGAGVAFANSRRWSIDAAYDYLWRSQNYSAQQLTLRFVLRV